MVKLFVGNLPPSASTQSLKEIFQQYPDLKEFKLISNYGFVYLETEESAIHAVNNLNGLDYRGFPIAVDFARDPNQLKRKADAFSIDNRKSKPLSIQPQRFIPPAPQQRNTNPYNLPFLNNANSIIRSFDNLVDKRYTPMPYNNGFESYRDDFDPRMASGYPANQMVPYSQDIFNRPPINKRMKPDNFIEDEPYDFNYNNRYPPDFQPPDMYSHIRDSETYRPRERINNHNLNDFNTFIRDSETYRPRERINNHNLNDFNTTDREDNGYFQRSEFPRGANKSFMSGNMNMLKQPTWYEMNRHNANRQYLSDRDQQMYIPRRGNKRDMKKSYIDEYEDNNDYSSVDPYPAYLKQYQK